MEGAEDNDRKEEKSLPLFFFFIGAVLAAYLGYLINGV